MKNLYYEFYPAENVASSDIKVFMYCGSNIPTECFCGCGQKRLFTEEEQNTNYEKKTHYRFFHNTNHIKRYKSLNKPNEYIFS
jgi:hypothetical protein